ncbi:MAG: hypothetical protein IJS88_06300 [Alphaproteobacteria bacterium]|nr:hypothetical protein [Alphaproteobacteria bacterium]
MNNGLRKVFVSMMAFFAIIMVFSACEKATLDTARTTDTDSEAIPVVAGYVYEAGLRHYSDTALKTKVSDQMTASIKIWRTEDGVKTDVVFDNQQPPRLDAYSDLARKDYQITKEQLDIRPISERIARATAKDSDGNDVELDTVYHSYGDAQVMSIPVKITSYTVEYGGNVYYYPSVTLVRADFRHLKNTEISAKARTRASYVTGVYNTEYKVDLVLKETNKLNPETFTLPVYAYTTRSVLEDDAIKKVEIENKTREIINETDERCKFDKIITWKSGEQTRENVSIILKRKVGNKDPYSKDVKSFDYKLSRVNGIKKGSESENRTEGKWTVWRKTDTYSADLANGTTEDLVVTEYSLMHERATYKDDNIEVSFDYEDYRVDENSTTATPRTSERAGYSEALLENKITATYVGYSHKTNELVYLYKPAKKAVDYKFDNPALIVYKDSIVGNIDFITVFDDETQDKVRDHICVPRTLQCLTDWEAYQEVASQTTSSDVSVSLMSSNEVAKGYWKYVNQTRRLNTVATLYDGSSKDNTWEAVVPNAFVYEREGKKHVFDNISFAATQLGGSINHSGDKDGFSIYDYSDAINVIYGDNVQRTTAPGVVKVSNNKVVGYEIRNKKLDITYERVVASLDFVTKFANGTETTDPVSKEFPRSLTVTTDWTAYESVNTENTAEPSVTLVQSSSKSEDDWTWKEETRNISAAVTLASSKQTNGWTSVDPNNIVFTRQSVTADFGKLTFTAIKVASSATLAKSEDLTDTYTYSNTISVSYGNSTTNDMQNSTAPGKIIVQKGKTVTDYEIRNPKLVVSDNDVTASLDFITKYSDGSENSEAVSKVFARSLVCNTDWSSNEVNNSELTGSASVTLKSNNKIEDGNWSYKKEIRDITTIASLAGSQQTNGWTSEDPNSITYSREGKTYTFDALSFSATEAGHSVQLTSDEATSTTYTYSDKIDVAFGGNTKSSTAPGKIVVAKTKTVTDYEIRNPKLVVSDDNVTASLDFITKYSDGTENSEAISKVFARSLVCNTDWSSNEINNSELTGSASVSLKSNNKIEDGNWSYKKEIRDITTIASLAGSQQTNGWTSEDPNSITYSREGKTYTFDALTFSATEAGHSVQLTSDEATSTTYTYSDKIDVAFGGNTKSSTAPGKIVVAKTKTVTGYEIENPKITVNQDNVTTSLTWVTLYSDGTKKTEEVNKIFNRNFKVLTNWSSKESDNSQTTGSAKVDLTSSSDKTDGYWSYTAETRSISTTAKLKGSTQENKWESKDPNKIVYTREGKTHDFGILSFSASESGASVKQKSDNINETVYSYSDKISVSYGSNSFDSSAPGTITVAKPWNPDFPDSYGKFTDVKVTASKTEGHNSWLYVVSIHFENGTLPLLIRQNASAPDAIDKSMFTSSTDSRLNSAIYITSWGKWINAIAYDASSYMSWDDTDGDNIGMLAYSTATMWGWDDGHTTSGDNKHPTVFTDKYSAKLSENNTLLTIYNKSGKVFATYKSAK